MSRDIPFSQKKIQNLVLILDYKEKKRIFLEHFLNLFHILWNIDKYNKTCVCNNYLIYIMFCYCYLCINDTFLELGCVYR